MRFGRKWPNLSLNKDFDIKTWTDYAVCHWGDFIFGPGSNSEALSASQRCRVLFLKNDISSK